MTDLKVLSTHAVEGVLCELAPYYERATGVRPTFDYEPANAIRRRIENGIAFDVAIVTRPVIDSLIVQNKVRRENCTDIARSGLGLAVRKGAARPDIASADSFKRAILAAKSVVRSKDGTSGLYFETLLDRLGIADAMRGRIILGGSGRIAELVARGEAEIAVQQIPELLAVTGADFVGPLPAELQLYTVFSAGVGATAREPAAAGDFVCCLTNPTFAPLYIAKGLEPMTR
jgi:molybdate transport system substrate-binding protein